KPDGSWVHTANVRTLAKFCDPFESDGAKRQEIALFFLFKQALHVAMTPYPAQTEEEVVAEITDYLERAKRLRTEAKDTERLRPGAGSVDWKQVARGMQAKADVLEQAAAEIRRFTLVVPNVRHSPIGLEAASRISAIIQALYGKPMPRQAAI